MRFILLELYVDSNRPDLLELYKEHVEKHNASFENNPYPNAGFDLFIPDEVEFDTAFQTKMVDLRVRTQMWEFLPKAEEYTKTTVELKDGADTITTSGASTATPVTENTTTGEVTSPATASEPSMVFNKVELNSFEEYMSTGYYLFPRSSIAKTQLMMANHVGVIDSGYRNNLLGAFRYLPLGEEKTYKIASGTRLVQICHPSLLPIYVSLLTDEKYLTKTQRTGGFGSTGGTV
jgi:dUTPase